jgi:hypothetical protein
VVDDKTGGEGGGGGTCLVGAGRRGGGWKFGRWEVGPGTRDVE